MTFFPSEFDPRDAIVGALDLVEIDTTGGIARFIAGIDGVFTDISGNVWYGSQLITMSGLQSAIDGAAPPGTVTLSFFQDPDADSLISQLRALGVSYIEGRDITFYVQPIRSQAEFCAPTTAPIPWMKRTMRTMTFSAQGAQGRSITLTFESWAEHRRSARRIRFNTEGHAQLTGSPNPSLEFAPTTNFEEESLFG